MGKGDKRTRRGKIYNGSHGKKRPGRKKADNASPTVSRANPSGQGPIAAAAGARVPGCEPAPAGSFLSVGSGP